MHILVVNDDGPPSRKLSPYVRPLVDALQDAGHQVSVAVPAQSRSWIGKAHIIGASLTATYVHPDLFLDDGTWTESAAKNLNLTTPPKTPTSSEEHLLPAEHEWVVVSNGTPASCAQLGIFELFQDRGVIDLVISGPNHGRNASTIYNLSSGTVGGALEAATCGKRGIALSFGSKEEQALDVIRAAARLSARLIEHLYRNWDERVELYNLNVPMRADVESRAVRYTRALPNVWSKGSLYAEVGAVNGGGKNGVACRQRQFQWSTELSDIKRSLQESGEGTDARTVLDGYTSVTPLLANFWHPTGFSGELKLDN
ncbi:putative acid phosphatase [Talaromyces proteolyticus]|uniref:Acid phosphatase n=1 Tax=Talaromyces proteolyticus TaxID=1131652 RepID=A0AAD4Q2J5_9EURO|nr:putative acid phosphatase [Talaromyces proteolyticus]KAH8700403.1 putative acid phosphatase [Talaromyces proteolyticus]